MIIAMAKVRIMGPRDRLADVLRALQDLSLLHLAAPEAGIPLDHLQLSPAQDRERRHLLQVLDDLEFVIGEFGAGAAPPPRPPAGIETGLLARWARLAGRLRRELTELKTRAAAREEERALILKYEHFFSAFRALLESEQRWPNASMYHVLLRGGDAGALAKLKASLTAAIGAEYQLFTQPLPTGETAVLVVVSATAAGRVERLLLEANVQEIPVPAAYGGGALSQALPKMLARLGEIPAELAEIVAHRADLARRHLGELVSARAAIHDRLRGLEALPLSGVTPRAFVLEGWVPAAARPRLDTALAREFGASVVVSVMSQEEWASEEAPVVLSNPRLFRPFETVVRLMPLPQYGTIDPTPFVAVFFPAFFGIIVGDIGYGLLLAALGLILHRRSKPGTVWRNVAEMSGPCALFTIIGGFLYGEFFGDLGRRLIGLQPLVLNREQAMIPFLLLAIALGVVHVLIGLGLGAISAMHRHPRQAAGRGVSLLMVVLIVLALLAAAEVLPHAFFTPAVVGLLIAFPVLIVLEGLVAPIELLSTVGNILSYARIMALGVASVMLAVVANRMVGAIGSVAVGVLFALLFHLVNFAIALFTPTIHALRLHYVEFFGKFYSPGGVRYQPFGHWSRS